MSKHSIQVCWYTDFPVNFAVQYSHNLQLVDVQLTSSDGSVFFMYGGARQSTSKAMIAAGHDLKGLMSFYNAQPSGVLHYPLMALIGKVNVGTHFAKLTPGVDYKGFRLSAQSFLPISKSTIKYGTTSELPLKSLRL